MIPLAFLYTASSTLTEFSTIVSKASLLGTGLCALLFVNKLLIVANYLYQQKTISKLRPITGYVQIAQIVLTALGLVGGLSILMNKSPWVLLSGIGAFTAVILLLFRETILSVMAGFEIQMNDIVRVGDWIEMPQHGVDGDVIELALRTVKIQNWDKTISTVPTSALISEAVKNWRGMAEAGGRRIKRSILIDQDSIQFVSPAKFAQLKKIDLLKDYLENKLRELKSHNEGIRKKNKPQALSLSMGNERRLTNVGTFRAYTKNYLRSRQDINRGLTFLIRQLAPSGEKGLPLEIYIFTKTTEWVEHEEIQADIMDHLLAVLPQFDLRTYQRVTSASAGSRKK